MKKRVTRRSLRSICCVLACMMSVLTTVATTAQAGATWHNVAGVSCAAYNNNQADKLERSHVRLLNPSTNTQSLWVICGAQRVQEDLAASGSLPTGWFGIFFDSGVTQSVTCIARDYNYTTVHVPGGASDSANTINQITTTINPSGTLPAVNSGSFTFTADSINAWNFITFACKLPPGTGINSIDILQQ